MKYQFLADQAEAIHELVHEYRMESISNTETLALNIREIVVPSQYLDGCVNSPR